MVQILGKEVGSTGYGLMGFGFAKERQTLDEVIATMKAAFDRGCRLWSGAEFYGPPDWNSQLFIKEYFTRYPEDAAHVIICIKGGLDTERLAPDTSAAFVRRSIDNILAQLGGAKSLDIFALARRDTTSDFAATLRMIREEYVDTGKVGGVSLSECSVQTIDDAVRVVPVQLAELELSLFTTDILHNGIAAACAKHDIPIMAYSPVGRGLLTGAVKSAADIKGRLGMFPRFQGEALDHNLTLTAQVQALAAQKGCTLAQLALAWVRRHNHHDGLPAVIPIPGTTSIARVQENTADVLLTDDEFASLSKLANEFETAGDRYPSMFPTNT
ncbi:aldo/keto reductase [Cordyceps javanica]|uniref:Aldo/keto reductase n=1 Tax=Cordyceps javanica TaxID=43265 RepID=A0A545W9E9_9HYPO|nr:aldo/keto reductase [Cordyceps javanica]TQW10627.1 aldo/keto reductase [Cordyceps javanica]